MLPTPLPLRTAPQAPPLFRPWRAPLLRRAAVAVATPPSPAAALTPADDAAPTSRAQATLVDFFRQARARSRPPQHIPLPFSRLCLILLPRSFQASPYIAGHRGRTFVVVIPGEVVARRDGALDGVLADVALVHSLGVRLVLVVGCGAAASEMLVAKGVTPVLVAGLRVTDAQALSVVCDASAQAALRVTSALSRGPPVPAMRRAGDGRARAGAASAAASASAPAPASAPPAVRVATGNFVAAKHRGVVGGVDYGETGDVRSVDGDGISARLADGDVVLLSNLGYSPAGEVLNCSTWEVAAAAAAALRADKMVAFARNEGGLVRGADGELLRWLPLDDAEELLADTLGLPSRGGGGANGSGAKGGKGGKKDKKDSKKGGGGSGGNGGGGGGSSGGGAAGAALRSASSFASSPPAPSLPPPSPPQPPLPPARPAAAQQLSLPLPPPPPQLLSPPPSATTWLPPSGPLSVQASAAQEGALELACCVSVCRAGVPRCHVLDASVEGALILELYTCDGCGLMVSADQYEGTRAAVPGDAPRVARLLAPLEADGTLAVRPPAVLAREIGAGRFTVVERDGKVVACASLVPFGDAAVRRV